MFSDLQTHSSVEKPSSSGIGCAGPSAAVLDVAFAAGRDNFRDKKGDSWVHRNSNAVVYLAFSRGEVAERLKAAVCSKVAQDQRAGLKFTISGPFSIGSLVGVGCRLMDLGPSLGTLEPTPTCAYRAHIVLR